MSEEYSPFDQGGYRLDTDISVQWALELEAHMKATMVSATRLMNLGISALKTIAVAQSQDAQIFAIANLITAGPDNMSQLQFEDDDGTGERVRLNLNIGREPTTFMLDYCRQQPWVDERTFTVRSIQMLRYGTPAGLAIYTPDDIDHVDPHIFSVDLR